MDYGVLKTLHILSSTLLFGTGIGTAYFMWLAIRSGDTAVIAHTASRVVVADWIFTAPTVIVQPLTGFALMHLAGYPFERWILWSLALFVLAGLCWLPVVWLQIRLRDLAASAAADGSRPGAAFERHARTWFRLGIPAFTAMVLVFFLMVLKPA